MTLSGYLRRQHACSDALAWVADRPASEALWRECRRPDWMLWVAHRAGVDRRLLVLCATGCARAAGCFVPAGEDRPRVAIEAAEAWAYGRGTASAVWAAMITATDYHSATSASRARIHAVASRAAIHAAAYAACAAHAAADAAAYADCACAANAANAAAYAAAAYAAAHAAHAADAAAAAVRIRVQRRFARGVRSVIPWAHVAERLRAAGVEVLT